MSCSGVTRLLDGPAANTNLMLRRAPVFMRIVRDPEGKIDALDQLEDIPEPGERMYVYRSEPETFGMVFIRPGGRYEGADYRHLPDVDPEPLRENTAWRTWASARGEAEGR
jgi:hypothetical protein